ncbi:protein anachronism isoform X2 [Sitodiplosis mosellana]|uniref:protein anachronism isoform X2 n=1 Tax=Sitodiplosis mosellana TaxID=263140 RepID=UPI002444C331|nr:protein anachronism isoform X2 [Sitodiplosis mosellana]
MSNLSVNVNCLKCVILLVLLLSLPLNGSGGNLDSGQNGPTDSSQQTFRHDSYGNDQVINRVLNINDSNTAEVLNNFNVSKDEILRRIAMQAAAVNNANLQTATVVERASTNPDTNPDQTSEPTGTEIGKQEFLNMFRERLESMVSRDPSRINAPDLGTTAIHDMAFYPLCSKNNQTSWLEENTAKLYFSSSIFDKLIPNTYLHRAVLRLRQKIPDNAAVTDANVSSEPDLQNGCSDVDDIIHVKVSIFVKHTHRGDPKPVLKKLVCHSLTLNRVNSEWVEIDVRQVIKYWEKMYRASLIHNKGATVADPMVAIDVEDEYQQPLKAGLFFEPTDCQASPAVPWVVFGENIWTVSGTQILPFNPRLDIRWSRIHAQSHSHNHRGHRARMNRLENVRLLNESPLMPADYQYQASADQSDLNLVSTSSRNENSRNHRKRHAQQKKHNRGGSGGSGGYFNEPHRMRRSLQHNKRNQAKRKFITRVA